MRWTTLALAAAAGIAASAFAAPAGALTPTSSAGLRPAAESIDQIANVHCRPFKHRSYNHGWGFGCRGGASVTIRERGRVSVHEREGVRGRVSIHEREGTRARVHERSSTRTDVRSRESTRARGEVKTGTSRNSTTGRTGTTGNRSESGRGTGGGGGTGGQSPGGNR
jgi:hypothetical protein